MSNFRVYAFQTLRVVISGTHALDLGSPTTRSLFAYLLLSRSHPTDRRLLAFCFWPRTSESAARRNLRQYLHRLRQILDNALPGCDLLLASQNGVQFNPHAELWLDVDVFRDKSRPEASLAELKEAIALYTGDLLEDQYEDWCQEERQELHHTYLGALERLSSGLKNIGKLEAAIAIAKKWVLAEPLDEAAHRQLMTLYSLNGERNRAIQHYQALVETLGSELGTEPLPETRSLLESIQAGSFHSSATQAPVVASHPRTPARLAPLPAPMVGRQVELDRLFELHQAAEKGQGNFCLITGESGIGKTRLVDEYQASDKGRLKFQVVCHELEAIQPYAPLRRLLAQAASYLPESLFQSKPAWLAPIVRLAPSLSERFPYLTGWEDSSLQKLNLTEALIEFFLALVDCAAPRMVQVVFDDLQWGDGQTWELLARLARRLPTNRMLVLGLVRLEDLSSERLRLVRAIERNDLLERLPLQRLSMEETAELAAHVLPGHPSDTLFLHRLYQETEGNPFFILEITTAIRESGKLIGLPLESGVKDARLSLPLSIQRAIEARLDRLSDISRELLGAAAVIGRSFTFSLLEEISQVEVEEIVYCVEEWVQRDLVREDAFGYNFSHDKIRQVVYVTTSRARRQYIHRRVAEVLENAIPAVEAGLLSHHYAHSDQPARALPYLTRAGEEALQSRSYHEARQFGLQAISLLGRMTGSSQRGERVDASLQLAQAYAFTGDLGRAQEILTEVEAVAIALGDEVRQGVLFHRMAQLFWLRGHPAPAGDYARRTLRIAEELNDRRLLQAALRMLGRVSIATSTFDDAIAYLRRYTNLDRAALPPADLPVVLGYLGIAYTRVGSWESAFEVAGQGVHLAESAASEQMIAFARMQLAFVYAYHRDWQGCLEVLEPTQSLPEFSTNGAFIDKSDPRQRLTPLGFMLLGLKGLALVHNGQARPGIELIKGSLTWALQVDYRVFNYFPRIFLAEANLLSGELQAARAEIELALEQSRTAGNRWAVGVSLRLLSEILTHQHAPDWSRIESHLIEAMQILRQVRARPELARTYLALRKLYDRAGQIAWAVDCHFRATSIFEELGMGEELRQAQGQAAVERKGAIVIPNMKLQGPNR